MSEITETTEPAKALTDELKTKAWEYADGQLLIPTVVELDEMRMLLRLLSKEVQRLENENKRLQQQVKDFYFFENGGLK